MQLFIGFDVGGTHIKHGVIDENGKELTTDEYDTPEDKNTFKKKWKAVVEAYQDEHDIVGIGVSFPGHINHHSGEAAKAGAADPAGRSDGLAAARPQTAATARPRHDRENP